MKLGVPCLYIASIAGLIELDELDITTYSKIVNSNNKDTELFAILPVMSGLVVALNSALLIVFNRVFNVQAATKHTSS